MCVCICVCVCIYVYAYVCKCIYVCVYVYAYIYICIYTTSSFGRIKSLKSTAPVVWKLLIIVPVSFLLAFHTKNIVLKTEIFQLLSAICLYSRKGRDLVLKIIDVYKVRSFFGTMTNYSKLALTIS